MTRSMSSHVSKTVPTMPVFYCTDHYSKQFCNELRRVQVKEERKLWLIARNMMWHFSMQCKLISVQCNAEDYLEEVEISENPSGKVGLPFEPFCAKSAPHLSFNTPVPVFCWSNFICERQFCSGWNCWDPTWFAQSTIHSCYNTV